MEANKTLFVLYHDVKVQSPVLVVELNLNRIEGTQLRALGLLAVYGFNVTYEVRAATQAPGPSSCSAIECRLLGHCYARHDYQEFYCSCFDGYSGVDCGVGPLCPTTSNMCKNGGTCRQMGPAAVSCICAPGYTGDLCEAQVAPPGVSEAERLDSGKWSCAADDAGRRRCRALRLTVLRPPEIRLVPSTLTVHKGDNVSITCLAGAGRVHGALGFSWARERTLLPMAPGREVWEDLYPAGSVLKLYNVQFTLISMGYSWGSVSHVSRQYGAVLRSLPTHPGEGEPPLTHAVHMLNYLMSPAAQPTDRYHSAEHLLNIYDNLLKHPDAFLDEEKVFNLQNAVMDTAGLKNNFDRRFQEFTVKTKAAHNDIAAHFDLQPFLGNEEWFATSVGVELTAKATNTTVATVLYHNLGARLPSLRRYIEYKSGCATQYTVASQQIQVSVSGAEVDPTLPHIVTLLFAHSKNYSANAFLRESVAFLATRLEFPYLGLATIALFTVDSSSLTDSETDLRGIVKITVSLGSAMCLVAALLQLLSLVAGNETKLPVMLKAATAATHSASLLALLECDTRHPPACVGPLGWAVAACWCAGCAALCAQPLLLHTELAATATRAPSVGLLAGVSTMCWLTARLWGGAPLQLGAAANVVCGAGAALLAALTLCLALCAARTLRTVTHKLPPDRREYVRERARVVRHTLVLLFTTTATQAAGVAYAQPGERTMSLVVSLSIASLANGLAMLICYLICDEECLRAARRLLTLSTHNEWQGTTEGDTSLSLYIRQGREMECRGAVGSLECSSSHVSPANTYWRATPLQSPLHRRGSSGACVADIVRCVEYKQALLPPRVTETRALCDLIPTAGGAGSCMGNQSHVSHVCVELRVLPTSPPIPAESHKQPYTGDSSDTPKESCKICSQSNPDVSAVNTVPRPIKSCLKKRPPQLSWSTSLPSIHHESNEQNNSHLQLVDTQSQTPTTHSTFTQTDKVLHKISHDLDFLLNRTPSRVANNCPQQIEEAPT
ncbi:unnamed protein product [Spodoptera littoralis]|uniref:Uncharacterized protein n=1 Tax=Spodoptera littoralis TaxID=7109 RepID=A0A9P0I1R6_SPOLI|nr:unnamed protein product [Spodoptera littoralis]CAH1637841.1 unnamed protein product [Spodoptera littoralis]